VALIDVSDGVVPGSVVPTSMAELIRRRRRM